MNNKINNGSERVSVVINSDECKLGLYLFRNPHKTRTVQNVPSCEVFCAEVDKIFSENTIKKFVVRRGMTMDRQRKCYEQNRREKTRYETSCRSAFFTNEIIKAFLMRKSVAFNEYGIPEYPEAERKIYDFKKVPYIFCRNLSESRMSTHPIFWSQKDLVAVAYKAINRAVTLDDSYSASDPMLAFNLLGVGEEWSLVLPKNQKRFSEHKEADLLRFNGIHFVDHVMEIDEIITFLEKIRSQGIKLDSSNKNIFVLNMGYDDHHICGALVVDSSVNESECQIELVLFDSSEKGEDDSYEKGLIDLVNKQIEGRFNLKFTYVPYGSQADGIHKYDLDWNCFFYSAYAMNALVRILTSSEDSVLRTRLLGNRPVEQVDNDLDIEMYVQEIRKELPDYFHLDSDTGLHVVNSFEKRQSVNCANRWLLGRLFLKRFFAGFKASS